MAGATAQGCRGRRAPSGLATLACLLACTGSPAADRDADAASDAPGDAEPDGPTWEITPPAPPALPVFTPCPPGWIEAPDPDTGIVTCDPWPAGGPEDCPIDEAHFPGEPGCVRLGPACAGEWASDLPSDATVLYVRAGGAVGGTGTRDDPFGTIAEAMARATADTVIALGQGTYDEEVSLARGVTLWGACVARTRLTCSAASYTDAVVSVFQRDTGLRNVRIDGPRRGVLVEGGGALDLRDVVVSEARRGGIVAQDMAVLTGRGVVVRDAPVVVDEMNVGIRACNEAQVELTRVAVVAAEHAGVSLDNGLPRAHLTDIVVMRTQSRPSDSGMVWQGHGLYVHSGTAIVERAAFVDNGAAGVHLNIGGVCELTDVIIDGTRCDDSVSSGQGVQYATTSDATQRLTRVRIRGSEGAGIGVGVGSVVGSDVVVDDSGAGGMVFSTWKDCSMSRLAVLRSAGSGIVVYYGCEEIEGEVLCGRVLLEDVVVRESRRSPEGYGGHGLSVSAEADVRVVRGLFERNVTVGVGAWYDGTELWLEDVTIRDTQPDPADLLGGFGLYVIGPARVGGTRLVLEHNRYVGIMAALEGPALELQDVVVADTLPAERPGPGAGGIGVGAYAGRRVDLRRFRIDRSALCGAQLAYGMLEDGTRATVGGTIDLHQGEVSENPIGVNIQTDPFDLHRLQDDVLYRDNERNLDMTELPVPSPAS